MGNDNFFEVVLFADFFVWMRDGWRISRATGEKKCNAKTKNGDGPNRMMRNAHQYFTSDGSTVSAFPGVIMKILPPPPSYSRRNTNFPAVRCEAMRFASVIPKQP